MLSAKDAAAQTAKAQFKNVFNHELQVIEQRIEGATNAGRNTVEILFEGNAFDEDSVQKLNQVLIDNGYQVKVIENKKLGHRTGWKFNIGW